MSLAIHIARRAESAYRAWCPSLPGCSVYGQSVEEARSRIREAVHGYVARLDVALPRELGKMLEQGLGVAAD
jgi:predicted RNase H-like HicB family nuclease